MDDMAKKTLEKISEFLPKLSILSQEKLISYGQGLEERDADAEKATKIKGLC